MGQENCGYVSYETMKIQRMLYLTLHSVFKACGPVRADQNSSIEEIVVVIEHKDGWIYEDYVVNIFNIATSSWRASK